MSNKLVKKVKPYPFKGEIKESATARPCQIVLLTQAAVLLEVVGGAVQPGDKVEVSFQTPVLGHSVEFHGLVVKVYNQLTGSTAPHADGSIGTIHRLEIHIRSIDPLHQNHIARFLDQIGQKGRT
jgi:hypothetical protein